MGFHIFHKWKKYDGVMQDVFLNKTVNVYFDEFRKCTICGKVQEFNWDSQGGGWSTLNEEKTKIFNDTYNA